MVDRRMFAIGLLAAGTLIFETTLTRFLGVAQFYHFAFLVVSLALLGLGASGTMLTLIPALKEMDLPIVLRWAGVGFAISVGGAYAGVNFIPFDSYSIAWERIQVVYFLLYYFVLSVPFLVSGLGVGIALSIEEENPHRIYGANLVGSAAGALLTPLAMALTGVPGAVLASGLMGLSIPLSLPEKPGRYFHTFLRFSCGLGIAIFFLFMWYNLRGSAPLGMTVSPYKGLSQAYRYPGSERKFGTWNAVSRIDVMANAGTRKLPGLSYQYPHNPPEQLGLSVDAGPPQPITLVSPDDFQAAQWMPEGAAFSLYEDPAVLVLNPGGGLGVLQALAGGADNITAVVENPLIVKASAQTAGEFNAYHHPGVQVVLENDRAFLHRAERDFDMIFYPLTDAFRPVTSGAFSLAEEYTLTVGGFQSAFQSLDRRGTLVITRWLQNPPSEGLRVIVTLLEAAERAGWEEMAEKMVITRSVQTMTVMIKPGGWTERELQQVRSFLDSRKFDLVWAPDIQAEEVNRYNRLPEPLYFREINALVNSPHPGRILARYPFDISPPDDQHPFFFHYFTWSQTPQVLATLGRTWQPFGGSGYFVLLALLAMVLLFSVTFIVLPLWISPQLVQGPEQVQAWKVLGYFGLIGFGFMLVEIPLIQRWILFLGFPIYAFAAVVGAILFFSGWGSLAARRGWRLGVGSWMGIILGALMLPALTFVLTDVILSWPQWGRVVAVVVSLAPLGFLMGIPFPSGLSWVKKRAPDLAPWAWAVNGFTSVIASVIASILALSYGYIVVFLSGLAAYIGAGVMYRSFPD